MTSIPPSSVHTIDPRRRIVFYMDPDTRQVIYEFPIPDGGVPKVMARETAVLGEPPPSQPKRTLEQRAYMTFWSNGMKDVIDDLIKNGRGAGLRQTLRWVLGTRIGIVKAKLGFEYQLVIMASKDEWLAYQAEKSRVLSVTTAPLAKSG